MTVKEVKVIAEIRQWKVTYQSTPYARNNPSVMLIEAATPAQAYAVAYDALTRRGQAVWVETGADDLKQLGIGPRELDELGVPHSFVGTVHIRHIQEHKVKAEGRVIEGRRNGSE